MKKYEEAVKFVREKAFVITLLVCFLSVAAMAGLYMLDYNKQKQKGEMIDLNEMSERTQVAENKTDTEEASGSKAVTENYKPSAGDTQTGVNNATLEPKTDTTTPPPAEPTQMTDEAAKEDTEDVEETAAKPEDLSFADSDLLAWPIAGNVVLDYSMDKTIYFPTLEQYKYNPAIVIAGEVNSKVVAAAKGIVKSVETNEETGTTVVMNIGSGYELTYGQLKEVPVAVGDLVNAKSTIGYVSEPTKYYSVEGSNLYFNVTKDGEPVDPLDRLGF